ncbi:MAG: outer membrane lipoprotein carrier protein LolA [Cyclobacteriaceae bacterium]|nr:outer membrane lipoprotein carrier protein LolA [Cyclobacteriaceae bacterium]
MNKIHSLTTYLLLVSLLLFRFEETFSQHTGFKPIVNFPDFKVQFKLESSKINSIVSDFAQEKVLTALTEKIKSEGKFLFMRNNKVRIEYQKPFTYLVMMNGEKMLVRDNQKDNRINVKSNKLFQQINRIMIDCVQGTMLDSKDFTVKVFEDDNTFLLEMTPVSKALSQFFQTIVLLVEKKDYSAKSIEMREPNGDKTVITFINKKLNAEIADAVFAL